MNVTKANEKAKELSIKYKTMAVAYVTYIGPDYDPDYEACLQESYNGDDEDIEVIYSNGYPLLD